MRKVFSGILAAVLILSACAMTVSASGHGHGHGRRYADVNAGVCDSYATGQCGYCEDFVDADGDGVCDNHADGQGWCGYGCVSHGGHGSGFHGGHCK